MMSKENAGDARALRQLGIAFFFFFFRCGPYDYDPTGPTASACQAAEAMGVEPRRVLQEPLIGGKWNGKAGSASSWPSDGRSPAMKKLAGRPSAARPPGMMRPTDAERLTGYRVGGISPCGQKEEGGRRQSRKRRLSQPKVFRQWRAAAACRSSSTPHDVRGALGGRRGAISTA